MTESDIYLDFCGCECPCPQKKCNSHGSAGDCTLEEPWFDCSCFQEAHSVDIADAENEIYANDNWGDWDDSEDEDEGEEDY